MKIWIDFSNVPHVHFLMSIVKEIEGENNFIFTCRKFSETEKLLKQRKIHVTTIGKHYGGNKFLKFLGSLYRDLLILLKIKDYDISISVGGVNPNRISKLKSKPSICFGDNENGLRYLDSTLCTYYIMPECLDSETLSKKGLKNKKLIQYNGFKEQIYLSDYSPDEYFLDKLPFRKFITLRGENFNAAYVRSQKNSLVPNLLRYFKSLGWNVLYLPRNKTERLLSKGFSNVFIPPEPLNGLDVCYYSDVVFTGAGTLAREASFLGTPAVSFYAGEKLLTVDQELIQNGKMFHSRNIRKIISYALKTSKVSINHHSYDVIKKELISKLNKAIDSCT